MTAASSTDLCVCGHPRHTHIYWESACRPGFVCPAACTRFVRKELPVGHPAQDTDRPPDTTIRTALDAIPDRVATAVEDIAARYQMRTTVLAAVGLALAELYRDCLIDFAMPVAPLGYYVLVRLLDMDGIGEQPWEPDWSGILHATRPAADEDAQAARRAGYEAVICELRRLP